MAHSNTQFDSNQIIAVAKRHSEMASTISQELKMLGGQVSTTASTASSEMTAALVQVYTTWEQNVNKVVLDNLNLMAESMQSEANNQEMQDSDNTRAITDTVSAVGSFLGG